MVDRLIRVIPEKQPNYQKGVPCPGSEDCFNENAGIMNPRITHILIKGKRRLGILDADHSVVELGISFYCCYEGSNTLEKLALKLAVSAVRGIVEFKVESVLSRVQGKDDDGEVISKSYHMRVFGFYPNKYLAV